MTTQDRNLGIDAFRVVAAFAIVFLHLFILPESDQNFAACFWVNAITRFAVPYFFIVSGYFFMKKFGGEDVTFRVVWKKYISKIFFLWASWSLLYFLRPDTSIKFILNQGILNYYSGKGLKFIADWQTLLFVGGGYHLWFLSSLIQISGMCFLLAKKVSLNWVLVIFFAIYLVGLLFGSYSFTPHVFNTRNAFFPGIFFAIGVLLYQRPISMSLPRALLIFGIGGVWHCVETWNVWNWSGKYFHNSLFGTILYGLGAFFLAYSLKESWLISKLSRLSRYTLGIYLVHPLIGAYLIGFLGTDSANIWLLLIVCILTFVCSLLTIIGMSRINWLKKLV